MQPFKTKAMCGKKMKSPASSTVEENSIAQWAINGLTQRNHGRIRRGVSNRLRQYLAGHGDPAIRFKINGSHLLMPVSHDLPIIKAKFPEYSEATGRLAKAISEKCASAPIIDIGANIGDSVAIFRGYTGSPILCVEGNPHYLLYLKSNIQLFQNIEIEESFVGDRSAIQQGSVFSERGSARISSGTESIMMRTLADILFAHPRFSNPRLLKIDTDGFDMKILNSSREILQNKKPVLFFEYDPHFSTEAGVDCFSGLVGLKDIGYHHIMVYENVGEFLLSTTLSEQSLLSDLHEFYSGRGGGKYCDMCVFHEQDVELAQQFHASEVDFFRTSRNKK